MNKSVFLLITDEEKKLPFYVKTVGGWVNQEHTLRTSGFTEYHWLHCTKGKGKLIIDKNEYIISENMGFFFYPSVAHEYYAVEEPWETRWLTFDGHAVPNLLELLGLGQWEVFHLSEVNILEKLINEIYNASQSRSSIKGFATSPFLYCFLIEAKNFMTKSESRTNFSRHKILQPVILYIEEHFANNLSLEEMAQIIEVTPYHLCRLFKQAFNMRPFVYLTRCRIKKAKEMIIQFPETPIKDVALKVGYNDASYFCAMFKEYEGLTPTEFKRMYYN